MAVCSPESTAVILFVRGTSIIGDQRLRAIKICMIIFIPWHLRLSA
jgi:hypothetical protein